MHWLAALFPKSISARSYNTRGGRLEKRLVLTAMFTMNGMNHVMQFGSDRAG